MESPADTQVLVWLRALKRRLDDIDKNLAYCIQRQEAGQLSQEEFDEFVAKTTRFAKKLIASTSDSSTNE